MKKFTLILSALMVLMCGFMFMGCDELEDAVNDLVGPENTWCCMPVEYKNSDSSTAATLYVWCYYTDTAVTGTGEPAGMKSDVTLPAGITMVVTAKSDLTSVIQGLNTNTYILKSFPRDSDTAGLDETDTSYSFSGTKAKWTALYRSKEALRQSENQTSGVLPCLATSSGATPLSWDNIKAQFSWKKLLASYLLN